MQSFHTIYQRTSAFIAIFNNILLIFLITYKSHKRIGKYKFLMIYISVFEILYALVDAFGAPTIFTKKSIFLVVVSSNQVFVSESFSKSFCEMYCVFYGISMAIFAIHFIYRYLVVTENQFVAEHETKVVFGLLTFPLLFGIFWLWLVRTFISPFEEADQYFRLNNLEKSGMNISDVSYAGVFFWPMGNDGKRHLHWRSSIGIMIMTVAIVISFALILVFGYKCYRKTRELIQSAPESTSFTKLQSQLFYALVFQTAIPVVLMHIPASIAFTASFFNISMEFLGEWCSMTICLYPALDPLPNFFIIKNYREAILNALRTLRRRVIKCKGAEVDVYTAGTVSEMVSTAELALINIIANVVLGHSLFVEYLSLVVSESLQVLLWKMWHWIVSMSDTELVDNVTIDGLSVGGISDTWLSVGDELELGGVIEFVVGDTSPGQSITYPNLVSWVLGGQGVEVVLESGVPNVQESVVEVLGDNSSGSPWGVVLEHSLQSFQNQLHIVVGSTEHNNDGLVIWTDSSVSQALVSWVHVTTSLDDSADGGSSEDLVETLLWLISVSGSGGEENLLASCGIIVWDGVDIAVFWLGDNSFWEHKGRSQWE